MKKAIRFSVSALMICMMLLSAVSVDAVKVDENSKYEEIIVNKLGIYFEEWQRYECEPYLYDEIYEYYSDENVNDEVPDYILVFANSPIVLDAFDFEYVGEYVLATPSTYSSGTVGYHIYVPKNDELYSLKEAYDLGIEGIEKVFSESGMEYFGLVGDVDKSGELNVKDATAIQKYIAGYKLNYVYAEYFSSTIKDFNRDDDVNIKDATAIQKHIAGIDIK